MGDLPPLIGNPYNGALWTPYRLGLMSLSPIIIWKEWELIDPIAHILNSHISGKHRKVPCFLRQLGIAVFRGKKKMMEIHEFPTAVFQVGILEEYCSLDSPKFKKLGISISTNPLEKKGGRYYPLAIMRLWPFLGMVTVSDPYRWLLVTSNDRGWKGHGLNHLAGFSSYYSLSQWTLK